jgi:hypothetical protein
MRAEAEPAGDDMYCFLAFGYLTLQRIQEKTRTAEPVVSENGKDTKQPFPMNPYDLES